MQETRFELRWRGEPIERVSDTLDLSLAVGLQPNDLTELSEIIGPKFTAQLEPSGIGPWV